MKYLALPILLVLAAACSSPDKPPTPPATLPPPVAAPPSTPAPDTAQESFTWQDEICSNTGYFPAGKYTAAQLRDSYVLVSFPYASPQYRESIWQLEQFHPDSIATRLQGLEQQHRQELTALNALRVVPSTYWQNLKKLRLGETEEFYQLRKLTLQAYLNPQLLLTAPRAGRCQRYVQALTTADTLTLLQAWRDIVDQEKKNNGDPSRLEINYLDQYHSPDRLRYARLELMLLGWYNCANRQRRYVDLDDEQRPAAAFEKLFTRVVRADCEDVD